MPEDRVLARRHHQEGRRQCLVLLARLTLQLGLCDEPASPLARQTGHVLGSGGERGEGSDARALQHRAVGAAQPGHEDQ